MPHGGGPRRDWVLTSRELEILRCLAAGLTRSETAELLGLSVDYVHHRMRLMRMRLAAKTDTHAVALVIAAGLLYPKS